MKRRIILAFSGLLLVASLPVFGDVVAQLCHLLTGNLTFDPAAGAVANPTTVTPHITPSGCEPYIHHRTADANVVVGDPTGTYQVTGAVTLYAKSINCPGYADKSGSAAYTISGGVTLDTSDTLDDSVSCQNCSGVTLTLTGTNDVIFQFVGSETTTNGFGGITGTGYSSPGFSSADGEGWAVRINTNDGTAPTWTGQSISDPAVAGAMAFKGAATYTLVQSKAQGAGAGVNSCTVSGLSAIGSGHLVVVGGHLVDTTDSLANQAITSVTDTANTYTHCPNCSIQETSGSGKKFSVDASYVLSSSSAGTSVVVHWANATAGNVQDANCFVAEYSY